MRKNKPMVVTVTTYILFLAITLVLTACQSSLALGGAAESPLSTPTVGPEWIPLPATDIWSVPPQPATPVPIESRPRPTPQPISPLPIPTPLPDYGIRVTGVLGREFVRTESGVQPSRRMRLTSPEVGGEILVGVVEKDTGVWTVMALNLSTGDEQLLFEGREPLYAPQTSGDHVIWTTSRELYIYSIAQRTAETLTEVGVAPRRARISGNVVVWEYLPSLLSADSDIWGYDLSSKKSVKSYKIVPRQSLKKSCR
ncbi:MAG: hypothetical protein ACPLYD_16570, partial [Anaerolineae bacterium]